MKFTLRERDHFAPISSVIGSASLFDSGVLVIEFNNGSVGCYSQVGDELFNSFRNAESAGSFYNLYIKGQKPSHVVDYTSTSGYNIAGDEESIGNLNTDDKHLITLLGLAAIAATGLNLTPKGVSVNSDNVSSLDGSEATTFANNRFATTDLKSSNVEFRLLFEANGALFEFVVHALTMEDAVVLGTNKVSEFKGLNAKIVKAVREF